MIVLPKMRCASKSNKKNHCNTICSKKERLYIQKCYLFTHVRLRVRIESNNNNKQKILAETHKQNTTTNSSAFGSAFPLLAKLWRSCAVGGACNCKSSTVGGASNFKSSSRAFVKLCKHEKNLKAKNQHKTTTFLQPLLYAREYPVGTRKLVEQKVRIDFHIKKKNKSWRPVV